MFLSCYGGIMSFFCARVASGILMLALATSVFAADPLLPAAAAQGKKGEGVPNFSVRTGYKVTLAPLACPYCANQIRAADAELRDNGDLRIICGYCHVDILAVEQR